MKQIWSSTSISDISTQLSIPEILKIIYVYWPTGNLFTSGSGKGWSHVYNELRRNGGMLFRENEYWNQADSNMKFDSSGYSWL